MPEKKDKSLQTEEINDWDKNNIKVVNYWMDYLSYCCLIYHFYLFKLKKVENHWAWILIVTTSLSSTFSILQYNNDNQEFETCINIFITTLTLFSTLISAWMKKQNYVEHISELSKYSLEINKLKGEVNSVIKEPIKNRMSYQEFIKKHKDDIVNCLSVRPLISPNDWKETIYVITKYYPELAAYEYPWKKIPNYGENAMKTYENIKYRDLWRKLKNGYFCLRCCGNPDYEKQLASEILNHDKNYYEGLPKADFDRPSHIIESGEGLVHQYDKVTSQPPKKNKNIIWPKITVI
jgi:Ca2+/Na+ antiporter